MTTMYAKMIELHKVMRTAHEEFVKVDAELRKKIMTTASVEEQADLAYALRESVEYCEDIRKRCNSLKDMSEKIACVLYTQMQMKGPIRTDHCTATPDIKTIVTIPRQSSDPEGFARLMKHLGIPENMWNTGEDSAVVKPHWPGLMAHLNKELADGKPLPPGVDPNKTYPEYKLIIRGKKGVSETP